MTDRIKGLTVVIEPNMRADDCAEIVNAIGLIKGVISVKMHVSDSNHHMAVETARQELVGKIWKALE